LIFPIIYTLREEYPMSEQDYRIISLPDGRRLSYAEYGDPTGQPLFFFHGFPGSRYDGASTGQVAAGMGLRVIAPDRPGMGYSDFKPQRKLLDWPDDVCFLADSLSLEIFGVLGYSGGGPHALACAYRIPERLSSTGVMAGVGPVTEPGALQGMMKNNVQIFSLAGKAPWLLNLLYRMQVPVDGKKLMQAARTQMAKPDVAAMQEPMVLNDIVKDFNEAFRQNTRGVVHEGALFGSDWGFKLSDIQATVHLWQGEEDTNVPAEMGRYQAKNIPGCIAKFYPGEGHISLVTNHIREILMTFLHPEPVR
jgi:pimeloyl-ACP methyl ester carboxylesterase